MIKNFLRLKNILPAAITAFIISLFVGGDFVAFAQANVNNTGDPALKGFGQLLSVFINILLFIAMKMMELGGKVMGTEWITGDEPMQTIKPMWVIVRNLTNVGFVVVLVFLAFSNLFSSFGEGGNWTIKDKLPKVIIALVAINFSLLGFKVVIDAVNVGTVTILSITDTTHKALDAQTVNDLLNEYKINEDGDKCASESSDCLSFTQWINRAVCTSEQDCLFKLNEEAQIDDSASNNLFLAFGVHFQDLKSLPRLAEKVKSWSEVTSAVLFSFILSLAYIVAFIAVFVALLSRMVILWIFMVFSPLLVAGWIMGFGGGEGSDISKKVVTNIIMPLKVAAAFAISFVMISALGAGNLFSVVEGSMVQEGPALSTLGQGSYGFLWKLVTVIVFWKAAFWALEGSEAEDIIGGIKKGAEDLGVAAARASTIDRHLFKIGKNNDIPVTLGAIFKSPGQMMDTYKSKQNKEQRRFFEELNILTPELDKAADALDEFSKKTFHMGDDFGEGVKDLFKGIKVSGMRDEDTRKKVYERILAQAPASVKTDTESRIKDLQAKGASITDEDMRLFVGNYIKKPKKGTFTGEGSDEAESSKINTNYRTGEIEFNGDSYGKDNFPDFKKRLEKSGTKVNPEELEEIATIFFNKNVDNARTSLGEALIESESSSDSGGAKNISITSKEGGGEQIVLTPEGVSTPINIDVNMDKGKISNQSAVLEKLKKSDTKKVFEVADDGILNDTGEAQLNLIASKVNAGLTAEKDSNYFTREKLAKELGLNVKKEE